MSKPNNILAVDVGNTRAKFGLFHLGKQRTPAPVEIIACALSETPDLAETLYNWWSRQSNSSPHAAIVAGSDPDTRDDLLARWPFPDDQPVMITEFGQIPLRVDVDNPAGVGIDRLLNAFAAGQIIGERRTVIIIDSGTATTVDLLTSDNTFRGGSILPGLRLSAQALHDYTARLPLLNVDTGLSDLPEVPGRDTESAMRAGLFIGQLGAVRELASRLSHAACERFKEISVPTLIVTGGGGRQIIDHLPSAVYVDSLALHGLAMLSRSGMWMPAL